METNRIVGIGRMLTMAVILLGACGVWTQAAERYDEKRAPARQIQSLDGAWEIIFDHKNVGRRLGWAMEADFYQNTDRKKISVPSCWEEIEMDYEGVAFYGHQFSVPKTWEDQVVRLQFDAVNYIAEVWVNDHVAGRHEGGYGPFEWRVDDLLKYGQQNFLSVRVLGPIINENKVIDGIGQSDMPHWRGAIAGGIWQSVRLVSSGKVYVDDVFVSPRLSDDTAKIEVVLENAEHVAREVSIEVLISGADDSEVVARQNISAKLVPGHNEMSWRLKIDDARYWSPADPHLYTTQIRVIDQASILDTENVRFGMRELTIRNEKFVLNGEPIYIKAAFFEGLYPTKLALPDSEAMARREIQLAKDAGFNMIRPWRKPPPPMWLDLCDEMGVMVIGGLPIECMKRWPTVTPHLRDRVENEVRSGVLRDRNRACIVQWEIFNEIGREDLERLKHPASMLARRLDPTRLILDESGGFAGGANIYLPGQFEPEVFNDVHKYPGAPMNDATYDKFLALSKTPKEIASKGLPTGKFVNSGTKAGRLTVVSEIGYGSLPDLVDNNARFAKEGNPLVPPYRYHKQMAQWIRDTLKESGLDKVYPDLQKFCLDQQAIHSQGNKRMLEAIRSNPSIGGYAVHALTGGDWVLGAGLLDLFRNPKESYWGTKEANQPRYLALRVRPRNIYAKRGANITLTGINDLKEAHGILTIDIISADGATRSLIKKDVTLASGISSLLEQNLNASKMAGAYTVRVQLTGGGGLVIAKNDVEIDVFTPAELTVPTVKFALLDVNNSLRPFLKKTDIDFIEFNANTPQSLPVFVSKSFAGNAKAKGQFSALHKFVKEGGTAVYLSAIERWGNNPLGGGKLPTQEVLPIRMTLENAKGLWVGVSHIVTDHPIFKGLPSSRMMGQLYENIWAPQTLLGTAVAGDDLIVGSVSHGWYQGDKDKQHHQGPSEAWFGMDMGVVKHGNGRYVLSAMRIVENLGHDPVADKLLFNLINWTTP